MLILKDHTYNLFLLKCYTYPDLSYEQVGLFFLHSKISRYCEVKHRVVIVDISDHYVHSSSGCLKEKKTKQKLLCYSVFLYTEYQNKSAIKVSGS